MLLCQVLEEEYVNLYGPLPYAPLWWFAADHLIRDDDSVGDFQLLRTITLRNDPLSEFLRGALRGLESQATLPDKINEILRGPCFYEKQRFSHVRLKEETRKRSELDLPGEENRVYLNRILLEEAYPDEIKQIHEIRLTQIYGAINRVGAGQAEKKTATATPTNAPPPGRLRAALCFSGGGIRSATFGLGVLQGLARQGLLDQFDYLSTVSGGGYVGSWLSAWIHRHPKGLAGVAEELQSVPESPASSAGAPQPRAVAPKSKLEPEPAPIRHLRAYSNYLSPKLGLLSADTWTLVGTYLRNLVLNWLVLLPLLIAALAIPRLFVTAASAHAGAWPQFAALALGFLAGVVAVVYTVFNRPSVAEASTAQSGFWRYVRRQEGFLWYCLLPLVILAGSMELFWAWHRNSGGALYSWVAFVMFGVLLHSSGWVISCLLLMIYDTGTLLQRFKNHFWKLEALVVPGTGAIGGLLVGWGARSIFPDPVGGEDPILNTCFYVCYATPFFLTVFLLAATFFVGVVSRWTSDEDREWWGRLGAWTLVVLSVWTVVYSLVIFGPAGLLALSWKWKMLVGSAGGVSGLIAVLLGRSAETPATKKQEAEADWQTKLLNLASKLAAPVFVVLFLITISFGMSWFLEEVWSSGLAESNFALPGPFMTDPRGTLRLIYATDWIVIAIAIVALAAFGTVMSWFININRFSLHSMYRDRLIRAYLGATRTKRNPNPFTGFDPNDNIGMHELRQGLLQLDNLKNSATLVLTLRHPKDPIHTEVREHLRRDSRLWSLIEKYEASQPPPDRLLSRLVDGLNRLMLGDYSDQGLKSKSRGASSFRREFPPTDAMIFANRQVLERAFPNEIEKCPPPPRRPLHVVNIALNLVSGDNLAWQQRKAETFSITSLHSGNYHLGYRRSADYGWNMANGRAISLGTAVTISGAAASPNMGYHSSSPITFLLTLFNVRLGWWLGNPGIYGQRTFKLASPTFGFLLLTQEALGLTDDKNKYIYLSDGGHFENLGIYEMVLRRCRFIVVSDAGSDLDCAFEDLGNAIRKIRIDLGVPITLQELRIFSRKEETKVSQYCALGSIDYSAVDGPGARPGVLVYLKPVVRSGQPVDVFNYAKSSATFPHETTGDQFFSESQFESYRMLGSHTIEEIFRYGRETMTDQSRASSNLNVFGDIVAAYLRNKATYGGSA